MPGPFFGIMVYGLMRASALRRTRLFGHYFEWDQILVPELSLLGEFVEIPEPLHFGRLHEDQSFRIPTWEARSTFMSGADKPRSWLMTRLGIILERFRVIGQSSVSRGEKARCYVHLVLFTGSRLRRQIRLWFWRIWARLTRGALIASKFTHIPLRFWALARCLRSDGWLRFGQAIRAAAIAEEDLVFTMAQAVMARNDRAANRMMECWLADPVEGRRLAAATALGARLEAISRRSWPRPAIKSERRTCAVLLAERVNLETSIRILRTLVDTLAAYGTAEEKVTMDRALSNRSDVDPFAIDEFRRCIRAELPDPQTTGLRFTGRCDALARS